MTLRDGVSRSGTASRHRRSPPGNDTGRNTMNQVFYIIGVVVVVIAVLSLAGIV
ncbi:MAG: hypothetical protein ACFBWO_10005 [Paracoccaceae bacterium]